MDAPALRSYERTVVINILAQVVDEIDAVRRQMVQDEPSLAGLFKSRECQDVFIGLPGEVTGSDILSATFGETSVRLIGNRDDVVNIGFFYDGSGHDFFSYNADVHEFDGQYMCAATKWRERLQALLGEWGMYFEDQNGYSLGIYKV